MHKKYLVKLFSLGPVPRKIDPLLYPLEYQIKPLAGEISTSLQ